MLADQRATARAAAAAYGLPLNTLHRDLHRGSLRTATTKMKSVLTHTHRQRHLEFYIQHVHPITKIFDDLGSIVHVDEKSFFLAATLNRAVLLPHESALLCRLRSKRHVPRVIVFAAVARPRWVGDTYFNGEIGV